MKLFVVDEIFIFGFLREDQFYVLSRLMELSSAVAETEQERHQIAERLTSILTPKIKEEVTRLRIKLFHTYHHCCIRGYHFKWSPL